MLQAKDIMQKDVITVTPDTEIVQAVKLLLENRINGLPVVNADGLLVGIEMLDNPYTLLSSPATSLKVPLIPETSRYRPKNSW